MSAQNICPWNCIQQYFSNQSQNKMKVFFPKPKFSINKNRSKINVEVKKKRIFLTSLKKNFIGNIFLDTILRKMFLSLLHV